MIKNASLELESNLYALKNALDCGNSFLMYLKL